MSRHSHRLPGAVAGVLAVGFTAAAMLFLVQLTAIGSTTTANGAPDYAPLAERYPPYPGPTATPTAVPRPDLIADKLEVTQAVQDLNNSVRLVQDKRTFVRFHVHSAGGNHATSARLTAQRGGATQVLAPLNPGGEIDVRPAPDRAVQQSLVSVRAAQRLQRGHRHPHGAPESREQPARKQHK